MADFNLRSSFKLVTDVSQWGLLTWPAKTRARLVVCTGAVTVLTVGCAFASAEFILGYSASVMLNLLLITANMFLLLVAAYLQTILIGDLFFSGPWRKRVFLGEEPDSENDGSIDVSAVNDHNSEFIVILFLAIIFNAVGLNYATGDFFSQYHDEGFFEVQMRADDPEDRIRALNNIGDPVNNRLWERDGVRRLVVESFDDPDTEVRQRAIWTAGQLEISRARSDLRDIAGEHHDPATRSKAAFTLGKLGRDSASREVLEQMLPDDEPVEARVGALRGLAMMEDARSVDAVLEHIDDANEEVMAHAFWALARIGSSGARDEIREILEEEDPKETTYYCGAMEAFKLVATEEDAEWARRRYRRTDPDKACEEMAFEEPNERIHRVVWGEPLRVKWLKTVGNTDPYEHERWIQRLASDPEEDDHVREIAAEILRQMGAAP